MLEEYFQYEPYQWDQEEKDRMLTATLKELTRYHDTHCIEYHNFLQATQTDIEGIKHYREIPFFPVRLFKEQDLLSIPREEVYKVMTSSGTSGQRVSKIYVNQENAMLQQKVMMRILADFWGKKRLPILVVDSPKVLKDRAMFSARGAAVIGLTMMAKKMVYVLNEDMTLNEEVLDSFIEQYGDAPFVVFGFTFMVWQHFYKALQKLSKKYDMSKGYLFTGGGWKKLESEAISRDDFKKAMRDVCNMGQFVDHYGMVEQTGCIYAECPCGHLHASIFSDVIIRNPVDFSECKTGESGVIQVVSALPHSYPGHSLLTEDEGMVLGVDDCPCGRKGKYIKVIGRMKNAEIRGCSDTYAAGFQQ